MSAQGRSSIGIDIGSRTTKIVRIQDGAITDDMVFDTGNDPLTDVTAAMKRLDADAVVSTGYGRRLAQTHLSCRTVTEIRACARGAGHLLPGCGSVIDIGGQDTKAIEMNGNAKFGRFEMNDRCAAGTGRFLEVMSLALGFSVADFGDEALKADSPVLVSSMCTVFAESEVVSMIARGEDARRISLGLHLSTARRVAAMASRIEMGDTALFVGGVANNPCMVKLLREEVACELSVPERPELAVAVGAALIGLDG